MENHSSTNRINALIIDDKSIIRDMFNFYLGLDGHHVTYVTGAEEALKLLRQKSFDIAFCDIVMPGKNGITLLKEIKGLLPDLPVVMMSGFSVEDFRYSAQESGAVGCLNKPFEKEELAEVIRTATGKQI